MKKNLLLFTLLLVLGFTQMGWGQTPTNGGFENGSINGTTDWTVSSGTNAVGSTNARTGSYALSHTTASTSNVAVTNISTITVPASYYGITIGWAVGSVANARASVGGTLNTTTSSTAIATIGTTLTRLTYASSQNGASPTTFSCRVNSRSVSGSVTLYWDDVITYASATATPDITKPNAPSSVVTNSNVNGTSITVTWTDGTDAATGSQQALILRASGLSQTPPSLNDQGVYSTAGGANGPNVVGSWSVVGLVPVGTQTFTDNTSTANTAYTYAVYMVDLAYNYSTGTAGSITSLPVELTSFYSLVKNKTVNLIWQTATEVNNYGFEVQRSNAKTQNTNTEIVWAKVGFVNGAGNSNSPKEYSFTDKSATSGKYLYRLKQLDNDGQYTYSKEVEVDLGTPTVFALEQNYPNPFNPTTSMQYSVSSKQFVTIKVFDMLGREVAILVNGEKEPGTYTAEFATTGLASGTYIYRMQAGEFVQTKKMVILK